ncbi:imidazole glycerol phosphate synthase subunit HisH [Corallococcus praedator]|uniref:Imidazole glycerol phosphate synthase subunit HisH n=1 Tax=Corallococcus praedator TaxID=2316724 RepID=A0ABX9Q815_9BACT|nr:MULTISPECIES: imidazole glycerol phosphate synthase subunit HisH [Corallococcus]RKH00098.1 imidazole glycerol phosphate synthase subunit HisH [Corallococcus sp. CA047B]RKH19462.1 imidazole glycerol phosphate synthase subunit HisH [Corallococcus sp. CA031C]RKH92275.1 imidazole glycerol phosphate synthase subunit HisH [Corallococcus praedator]
MRVTLFDYGAGNLHSLAKALATAPDVDVRVQEDPLRALDTDMLVLPGVGAFGAAAARLAPGREAMRRALDAGLPCLGICLGMQLLFDESDEGAGQGLGYFQGRVTRLTARQVPQIGWNDVEEDRALASAKLASVYFAHSYVCRAVDPADVVGWTTHEEDRFPASVRRGKVLGVQFHPEKSSQAGVRFVQAFLKEVAP